jgi:hypothetical protein
MPRPLVCADSDVVFTTSARALQSIAPMPRKQRFKPSRKPQNTQGSVSSQQLDDRKDIVPEQQRDIQGNSSNESSVIKGDAEVG